MDKQELTKMRGDIIERTINIERLLEVLITQHYFSAVNMTFMKEVLYDEYCSFGLKTSVVKKISADKALDQSLKRLGQIRNRFAHTGLTVYKLVDGSDHSKGFRPRNPDPKKLDEDLDYRKLYEEANVLTPSIERKLFDLFKKEGGVAEAHISS